MSAVLDRALDSFSTAEFLDFESMNAISVCIGQGMAMERPEYAGFSHLTEHVLAESYLLNGQRIRSLLFEHGIEVSAQTFPFHIELTLSFSDEELKQNSDLIQQVLRLWTAPHSMRPTPEAVAEARAAIREEVYARTTHSPFSTFPWSSSISLYSASCEDGHDGFADLRAIQSDHAYEDFLNFLRSMQSVPISVSLGTDKELPRDELRKVLSGLPTPTVASPPLSPRVSQAELVRSEISGGVSAKVVDLRTMWREKSTAEQVSLSALLLKCLNFQVPTELWQAGAFGPYSGPDYAFLTHAQALQDAPYEHELQGKQPKSQGPLPAREIARAAQEALAELEEHFVEPVLRSSLHARGILFGIDYQAIRECLASASRTPSSEIIEQVHHALEHCQAPSPPQLIWRPS